MIVNTLIYFMSIILIIYFIFLYIKIILNRKKKYPPVNAECPNYYTPMNKLGRTFCKVRPIYKKYSNNCDIIDITDMTELEKCNWSRECDIYWEGITNKKINNNNLC